MPGKTRKLDEAQKYVLSNSGTKMQLGSGWKPGRMGFRYVEFVASTWAVQPSRRTRYSKSMMMPTTNSYECLGFKKFLCFQLRLNHYPTDGNIFPSVEPVAVLSVVFCPKMDY